MLGLAAQEYWESDAPSAALPLLPALSCSCVEDCPSSRYRPCSEGESVKVRRLGNRRGCFTEYVVDGWLWDEISDAHVAP